MLVGHYRETHFIQEETEARKATIASKCKLRSAILQFLELKRHSKKAH